MNCHGGNDENEGRSNISNHRKHDYDHHDTSGTGSYCFDDDIFIDRQCYFAEERIFLFSRKMESVCVYLDISIKWSDGNKGIWNVIHYYNYGNDMQSVSDNNTGLWIVT